MSNFTVKIGHTSLSAFSSMSFQSGLTQVYSGNYTPNKGWSVINFTTPFEWNGSSNIIIDVCFDNDSYNENSTVRYSSTGYNNVIGEFNDDDEGCAFNSASESTGNRPNIRLYTLPYNIEYTSPSEPTLQSTSPDSSRNFIRTLVALDTCTQSDLTQVAELEKISETVNYFDGLGRLMQEVQVRATPLGRDLVRPVKYDNMGRTEYNYLPYPLDNVISPGAYREDDSTEQYDFYQDHFNLGENKPYAYSRTVYESSPLNRVLEQGAPGNYWQPYDSNITSSGHTDSFYYETDTTNEVMLWQVTSSSLVCNSYYASGELFKNTIEDENKDGTTGYGRFTTEYKDKQGNVVLKVSCEGDDTLQTYYIYDDFGLLRAVLPPKYTAGISTPGNHSIDPDLISGSFFELGYYYTYDERKRMVSKKLPGVNPVYMIYDNRDRLVLTQDSVLRKDHMWLFTKYDALNRPVITGKYKDTNAQHQTLSGMQAYINSCYASDTSYHFYEDRSSSSGTHNYTNTRSFPKYNIDGSDFRVFTVNYYDDYYFLEYFPGDINDGFEETTGLAGFPSSEMEKVKGQLTGTKINILDASATNFVYAVNYYDDRYRLIQRQQTFYPTGYGFISSSYDFTGKVRESKEIQWVSEVENTLFTQFSYDHTGRPLETRMKLNQGDTILLSQMRYNELGELEQKNLHSEDLESLLQSVDYTYNIRGWLSQINYPADLSQNNALFGMKLSYHAPDAGIGSDPQYNGNISAQEWKHDDETFIKGYGYQYDDLNRLISADYKEKPSTTWLQRSYFDVSQISYDLNGNIDTLFRYGDQGTLMDQLTYFYLNAGNRLDSVADAASMTGFYNGNTSGSDYLYDGNGNMKEDKNKDISITYNYLNLPDTISGEENIYYIYDASGVKWVKNYDDQTNTAYYGSFVYKSDEPQSDYEASYFLNPEGMINKDGSTYEYQYFLRDHLGNTRVVFSDRNHDGWIDRGTSSTEVLQRTDYYPFGMSFAGMLGGENKYLYNGKELQDDEVGSIGLDWYDYGARMYDPQIGRFHTKDPLMEWHFNNTPYHYCFNNPINFIDPFGLDTLKIDPNTGKQIPVPLPGVDFVTERPGLLKRILNKIVRALMATEDAITGPPEPYRETVVDDGVDMDWYKSEEPYGNQDVISRDNPNINKIFDNNSSDKSNSEDNSTNQTSDKQIVEQSTGTAEKTDADGRPLNEIDQKYGQQESDSVETKFTYYFDEEKGDSVQIWKVHKYTNKGRPVSKKYIEKR